MKHFTLLVAALLLNLGIAQDGFGANGGGGGGGEDCGCKESENPIHNGSFENGTVDWSTSHGADFTVQHDYAVCGEKNGLLFGHAEIWQDVDLGADYQVDVTAYGGTHNTGEVHKFKLTFLDEHGNVIDGAHNVVVHMDYHVVDNKLKQFSLSSKAPEGAKKVRFSVYSEGDYFKVDVVCMTITPPPMPVTLAAFNVNREGTTASLQWSTVSEVNSDHFEVQHSENGKTWTVLTSIQAQGESKNLVTYNYTHTTPSARNLYRLKMIDADETYAYSSIKSLNFNAEGEVEVFPNPTADRIRVTAGQAVANVKVFSANGTLVLNTRPDAANEVDLRSIAQGVYFVKINDSSTARRIVVAR